MPFTEQDRNRLRFGLDTPKGAELKILELSYNISEHLRSNPRERSKLEENLADLKANRLYVSVRACEVIITSLKGAQYSTPLGMRSADRVAKEIIVFVLQAALENSNGDKE